MTKSPWKFLVGLATRRRETDSEDAASASKSDTDGSSAPKTDLAAARHALTAPSAAHQDDLPAPTVTAANAPDPVVEDAAGAALAPPTDEVTHASAFAGQNEPSQAAGFDAKDAAVEAGAASPQVRRTRGPGRPKNVGGGKSAAAADPGPAAVERPAAAEPAVLADSPFLEQMASLDEEVQQLRLHLADKLRMQNEQLKKMLDRFNRPS